MALQDHLWSSNIIFLLLFYIFSHIVCSNVPVYDWKRLEDDLAKPLDAIVDANASQLMRVYHRENICSFRRKILPKLLANEPINVYILGGSATFGKDLSNYKAQRWSTLMENYLNNGWYHDNTSSKGTVPRINIVNQALPACNVDIWIHKLKIFEKAADVVIVDLTVNDQDVFQQILPKIYGTLITLLDGLPNHPAIFFHQAFRSAKKDFKDIQGHCPNDYVTCCDGVMFCKRWWDMQTYVSIALEQYQVPYMSYRDLVWPNYSSPSSTLDHFWNGLSHPDHKAHALIGKLLSYGLAWQMKEVLYNTSLAEVCTQPIIAGVGSVGSSGKGQHHQHSNAVANTWERYVNTHTVIRSAAVAGSQQQQQVDELVCPKPINVMQALEDNYTSKYSFAIIQNSSTLTKLTTKLAASATAAQPPAVKQQHWKFYDDRKMKFGWILETNHQIINSLCHPSNSSLSSSGSNQQGGSQGSQLLGSQQQLAVLFPGVSFCSAAILAHTLTLRIQVSASRPVIQIYYLKTYNDLFGKALLWLNDKADETIQLDGLGHMRYSLQHLATITAASMPGNNGSNSSHGSSLAKSVAGKNGILGEHYNAYLTGDIYTLPTAFFSSGRKIGEDVIVHELHISIGAMRDNHFKWKLLGIQTC